jgi:hypothetical protein
LKVLRDACQRFGERPRGAAGADGLFALRVGRGPWMVVGVSSPGADDRGRPGALAFHALFVSPAEYRKAGFDPFALAGALRREWGPETRDLAAGTWPVLAVEPPATPPDERVARIAATLTRGQRVALEADVPIDDLARTVWHALPPRVRRRASVATWAFGNGNRFDLVALPRLAGVGLDFSYVDPNTLEGGPGSAHPSHRPALVGIATVALVGLIGLAWGSLTGPKSTLSPSGSNPGPSSEPKSIPPDPAGFGDEGLCDDERMLVSEALADLADRFCVGAIEAGPATVMARIANRLRYRGPLLTADQRRRLAAETGPDAARALAWDAHVRHFLPDRPLPADFARGPLRWQLATLAWSYHLEPDPRRAASEIPVDLGDTLSLDRPIRPSPLAGRYPPLVDYARFLARLPRR